MTAACVVSPDAGRQHVQAIWPEQHRQLASDLHVRGGSAHDPHCVAAGPEDAVVPGRSGRDSHVHSVGRGEGRGPFSSWQLPPPGLRPELPRARRWPWQSQLFASSCLCAAVLGKPGCPLIGPRPIHAAAGCVHFPVRELPGRCGDQHGQLGHAAAGAGHLHLLLQRARRVPLHPEVYEGPAAVPTGAPGALGHGRRSLRSWACRAAGSPFSRAVRHAGLASMLRPHTRNARCVSHTPDPLPSLPTHFPAARPTCQPPDPHAHQPHQIHMARPAPVPGVVNQCRTPSHVFVSRP
jgi:hypothetical protein